MYALFCFHHRMMKTNHVFKFDVRAQDVRMAEAILAQQPVARQWATERVANSNQMRGILWDPAYSDSSSLTEESQSVRLFAS
jgi:hypothetical protein